ESDDGPHDPALARRRAEALALPLFRQRLLGFLADVVASRGAHIVPPAPHVDLRSTWRSRLRLERPRRLRGGPRSSSSQDRRLRPGERRCAKPLVGCSASTGAPSPEHPSVRRAPCHAVRSLRPLAHTLRASPAGICSEDIVLLVPNGPDLAARRPEA